MLSLIRAPDKEVRNVPAILQAGEGLQVKGVVHTEGKDGQVDA